MVPLLFVCRFGSASEEASSLPPQAVSAMDAVSARAVPVSILARVGLFIVCMSSPALWARGCVVERSAIGAPALGDAGQSPVRPPAMAEVLARIISR
ncbi:hypothetical protein GCM10022384_44140 [Streptomyces marokkonensis]|uniref:Secreted protein n=1 Tax=Streptomyces marokkonensis TaxID=324855 RepID=A0ABP7R3N2_9ACTN